MTLLGKTRLSANILVMASLAIVPSAVSAGGYGTAGVSDANVGQQVAQGGIWCPALEATISETLYTQMDCEGGPRDAVAGERITNERRGLFGIFGAHEPRPSVQNDDDDPAPRVTRNQPTPNTPSGEPTDEGPSDDPKDDDPVAANVGKWDRLGEIGVTRENYRDRTTSEFRSRVGEYRNREGYDGDWSGFNVGN